MNKIKNTNRMTLSQAAPIKKGDNVYYQSIVNGMVKAKVLVTSPNAKYGFSQYGDRILIKITSRKGALKNEVLETSGIRLYKR